MASTPPPPRRPGLLRSAASSVRRWLAGRSTPAPPRAPGYPGDFTGRLVPAYDPHPDGRPDPGEIVWTWVPFEEDHAQGKDRPVLLVGRDGRWLLALQLTSKDHDGRPAHDDGRRWVDIGAGRLGPPAPTERGAGRPGHPGRPRGGAARGIGAGAVASSTPSRGPSPTCTAEGVAGSGEREPHRERERVVTPRHRLAPGRYDRAAGRGIPLPAPDARAVDPQAELLHRDPGEGELARRP